MGNWIYSQRIAYRKGELSSKRIRQLEQVLGWVWNVLDSQWETKLKQVETFIQKKCRNPSSSSKNSAERVLGKWVCTQQRSYQRRKLSLERIKSLEQVNGWHWHYGIRRSLEQWVIMAEQLAQKHGGVLPKKTWLTNNCFSSLSVLLLTKSEFFIHIKQDKGTTNTLNDWIKYAEGIAAEHNGSLPILGSALMRKNYRSGLFFKMRSHPEAFAHIPQDKYLRRTEDEWLHILNQLAEANEGVIPNSNLLKKLGYGSVCHFLLHNARFAHFKWDRPVKNAASKAVQQAEDLSEEHEGLLPCANWLQNNGYSNILNQKRKHPDLFVHIPQQNKRQEWAKARQKVIGDAEKLAIRLGKLPNAKWLQKNGHKHIVKHRQADPGSFSHISQEPSWHSAEDWAEEAQRMAKRNGGRLPPLNQLKGYSGLIRAVYMHPQLFSKLLAKKNN